MISLWIFRPLTFFRKMKIERPKPPHPRGLLARIADAIVASNQRRADREIALYIARSGGKLTDGLEREIERSRR